MGDFPALLPQQARPQTRWDQPRRRDEADGGRGSGPEPALEETPARAHESKASSGAWCSSPGRAAADSVRAVEQLMSKEVERLLPRRDSLRQCVEDALSAHVDDDWRHSLLEGCRLEVVGSTSWGGAVPQSDLDLVLMTGREGVEGPEALEILGELKRRLEEQEGSTCKKLELVEAPRVPILRIHDGHLSSDISVDQLRSLRHRAELREALQGRPERLSLIRLVKYWLRRRGLPMAAEGGLPSLAWAFTALRLAEDHPAGTPVTVLLQHFFSKMRHLGDMSLDVHRASQPPTVRWRRRRGASSWCDEWVQLLWVDDPTLPPPPSMATTGCGDCEGTPASKTHGITPPSIPAALGALYVAELRLAWKAINEGSWDRIWRPAVPEARISLPSAIDLRREKAPLHILLKDGAVLLGQLQQVKRCPGVSCEALHRRDQSSELILQQCCLQREGASGLMAISVSEGAESISCQPCHWVCALPTWGTSKIVPGDGLDRLNEVKRLVLDDQSSAHSSQQWWRRSSDMNAGGYVVAVPFQGCGFPVMAGNPQQFIIGGQAQGPQGTGPVALTAAAAPSGVAVGTPILVPVWAVQTGPMLKAWSGQQPSIAAAAPAAPAAPVAPVAPAAPTAPTAPTSPASAEQQPGPLAPGPVAPGSFAAAEELQLQQEQLQDSPTPCESQSPEEESELQQLPGQQQQPQQPPSQPKSPQMLQKDLQAQQPQQPQQQAPQPSRTPQRQPQGWSPQQHMPVLVQTPYLSPHQQQQVQKYVQQQMFLQQQMHERAQARQPQPEQMVATPASGDRRRCPSGLSSALEGQCSPHATLFGDGLGAGPSSASSASVSSPAAAASSVWPARASVEARQPRATGPGLQFHETGGAEPVCREDLASLGRGRATEKAEKARSDESTRASDSDGDSQGNTVPACTQLAEGTEESEPIIELEPLHHGHEDHDAYSQWRAVPIQPRLVKAQSRYCVGQYPKWGTLLALNLDAPRWVNTAKKAKSLGGDRSLS